MSRRHKNRAAKKEVKEAAERECFDRREHYTNLLIWGHCTKCMRAFSLPADDTKVFVRLENLVNAGV
jgi:hypothetical protein